MKDFTYDEKTSKVSFGTSDALHIKHLLSLCKGWHKFYPFVGACLLNYLHDEQGALEISRAITDEIKNDGATIRHLSTKATGIDIEADYEA